WFRWAWKVSDIFRRVISRLPDRMKLAVTDGLAAVIYWPLARLSLLGNKLGLDTSSVPLQFYKDKSFYTMRTDSRDRFGTPLERRFTKAEIDQMMRDAGFVDIQFSQREPYWCTLGYKS